MGIRDQEEPIEAPGTLLRRTEGGSKGWGVIWTPVQDGSGGDPGRPSVPHHLQHSY